MSVPSPNTTVTMDSPVLEMDRTSWTSGSAYITASIGIGDELLHLLGGEPRRLGVYRDLDIGHVGKGVQVESLQHQRARGDQAKMGQNAPTGDCGPPIRPVVEHRRPP